MTDELSLVSSFVTKILFPLEFVATIENVAYPFVSLEKTVVVNVAVPPLVALVNSRPSKVPVKLPISEPSVSSVTVMVLPSFAKSGSPGELDTDNSYWISVYYCYDCRTSSISCIICNCSIRTVVPRAVHVGIYCAVCG